MSGEPKVDLEDTAAAQPGNTGSNPNAGYTFGPEAVLADRYRVLRSLARGGMGEVYEVEDLHLHEVVALKTLDSRLAVDALSRTRFQGEVKSARRISHPNVCRIFDFGVHGEGATATYFLTMELLSGETLESRMARAPLSRTQVLEVMQQVAAGVDAAHGMGVVHRDLKPSNVMLVQYSGGGTRAVVTDFGIARRVDESTVTKEGWVGTPAYIAPEQLEGKKVDASADIYTLGVMLFQLATGRLPFEGSSAVEVAMQRLARPAPRARELTPELPQAWDDAIARCLERVPGARWQKATDALNAMGAAANVNRRRPPASLGSVLALTAVMVLAPLAVGWWKLRSSLPSENRVLTLQVEMADGAKAVEMPEGFPPFNAAVSYVVQKEWRAQEKQRRFRVSPGTSGNVLARLRWKLEGKDIVATLELGAQGRVERTVEARAASVQALAKKLGPVVSEVVGDGQPAVELWPEEKEEATLLNAPTPEAYKELVEVFDAYFETITADDEPLSLRLDALIDRHPDWGHPVGLRAIILGPNTDDSRALARKQLANPNIGRDASGVEMLTRIESQRIWPSPRHDDRIFASIYLLGQLDTGENVAFQRELSQRWPGLQWGSTVPSAAMAAGKLDDAARSLQAWMAQAPGQREAWLVLSRLNLLQHRPLGPIELLFEQDAPLLLSMSYLWLVNGEVGRAADAASRISSASPRFRAMAQHVLALVEVLRGQLGSASERLSRSWAFAQGQNWGTGFWWIQVAREARRIAEVLGRPEEVKVWRQREVEAFAHFGWPSSVIAANNYAAACHDSKCPGPDAFVAAATELDRVDARRFIARVASLAGAGSCEEVLRYANSPLGESLAPWTIEYLRCSAEAGRLEAALPLAAAMSHVNFVAISDLFDTSVVDVVLTRYWYARLLEKKGDLAAAKVQYQSFLDGWGAADFQAREIDDARARLAALK